MRRARIKAVANLSASRRPVGKVTVDSQKENSEDQKKEENKCSETDHATEDPPQATESDHTNSNITPVSVETASSGNDAIAKISDAQNYHKVSNQSETATLSERHTDETATFKTPMQIPKCESESSSSAANQSARKFKRSKVAPRLNASRNVPKVQEATSIVSNETLPSSEEAKLPTPTEEKQQTPESFTLPSPTKLRFEIQRDNESHGVVVNHHIQHPGAPPSPFPYFGHGHSRIRTDSLCSMKSNRDITMANLQPRKNIRTEDQKMIEIKKESRERLSNKDMDKSQLRMFDMIYYNPQSNPMKPRSPHKTEKPKKEIVQEAPVIVEKEEPSAMAFPQLRLSANGEMVLDETSLVIENEQQKQNRILLASSNVVYDDDMSGNYGYYKRQQRTKEWPQAETVKFYRCLNTVGTDFSLMLNLFPNRSRRDLKLKFKKEEKMNPLLIDKALLKHSAFDLDELQRDLDEEEERRKKEAESKSNSEVKELVKRKILKKQEAKLKAEQQESKKVIKILSGGTAVMNIVDNVTKQEVKENLEILNGSVPKKRKKQTKTEIEGVRVIDLKAMTADSTPEPPVKKPRKYQKKADRLKMEAELAAKTSPKVVKFPSNDIEMTSQQNDEKVSIQENSAIQTALPQTTTISETIEELIFEQPMETIAGEESATVQEQQALVDKVIEEPVLEVKASVPQTPNPEAPIKAEEISNHVQETEAAEKSIQLDESSENLLSASPKVEPDVVREENPSKVQEEKILNEPVTTETVQSEPIAMEKKAEKKPKSRRNKFKPTLVNRLKLDANGEMVLDESAQKETKKTLVAEEINETSQLEVLSPKEEREVPAPETVIENIPVAEIPENIAEVAVEEEEAQINEPLIETEALPEKVESELSYPSPEPTPSGSTETTSSDTFDPESFLNSLDLEKLVLVEAQRNGKDVYEIHEIDPITGDIQDKPVDLPENIVDLIISVMLSQDEDDE